MEAETVLGTISYYSVVVFNSSLSLSSNTPSFMVDTSLQVQSQRVSLPSKISHIAKYKDFMAVLFSYCQNADFAFVFLDLWLSSI